jgi:hypothetical protein
VATVAGPAAGVDMAVSLIRQIIDKFNAMGGAASAGGGPRSRIPQNPQMVASLIVVNVMILVILYINLVISSDIVTFVLSAVLHVIIS